MQPLKTQEKASHRDAFNEPFLLITPPTGGRHGYSPRGYTTGNSPRVNLWVNWLGANMSVFLLQPLVHPLLRSVEAFGHVFAVRVEAVDIFKEFGVVLHALNGIHEKLKRECVDDRA